MSRSEKGSTSRYALLPPPQLRSRGELKPYVTPHLRDMPPFPGLGPVDAWERYESHATEYRLTEKLAEQAQTLSFEDDRVQELLHGDRYVAIGASLLDNRDRPDAGDLLYVFYNYASNAAIEVYIDSATMRVINVVQAQYQPAPTQAELDEAIALARKDRRIAEWVTEDLEPAAILVSPVDPDDPYFMHRQFEVQFGCRDERLAQCMALVDLSTGSVLRTGLLDSPCADRVKRQGEAQ